VQGGERGGGGGVEQGGGGGPGRAGHARAAAAGRGHRLDRALPQDLGSELQAARCRAGGAEGQTKEGAGHTARGGQIQAEEKETTMSKTTPLQVTTPSAREVVVTRACAAPRGMVFDAHTKPDLVRRWLLGPPGWAMPVCEIDLRVGGKYRYVWQHDGSGQRMGVAGTFTEIVRPSRIVITQLFDEDWTGGETIVITELTEQHGTTTLVTTVRYASQEARDAALKTGMTAGMEAGYERLDNLVTEEKH